MHASPIDPAAEIADAVAMYRDTANIAALLERLERIAATAEPEVLAAAVEPFRDMPEVSGPVYEHIVAERPHDARALVILASAYWLSGRGPDRVGELAGRALANDPENRGAWHLWALTEPDLRSRVSRWQHVAARFPADELARVNLADNAASLATTQDDDQALALAIHTYESLLVTATRAEQRDALQRAIRALRSWRP